MDSFDDLTAFLHWWLRTRTMKPPQEKPLTYSDGFSGSVLYRDKCYQVQLFMVKPNRTIDPHVHPNVDSYEVYVSGDIAFMADNNWYDQKEYGGHIRIKPNCWHGGKFGERGGCFLSVQKWLNNVEPTTVEEDWKDKDGNKIGTAY